jgi:DNA transformation protein
MPASNNYLDFVQDQLHGIGEITVKRMFGGAGLYLDGVFFAIVADDVLYFKVDDSNRPEYETAGMQPFRPFNGDTVMSYYEVPIEVLEDPDELKPWVAGAVGAAIRASARKPRRRRRGGSAME